MSDDNKPASAEERDPNECRYCHEYVDHDSSLYDESNHVQCLYDHIDTIEAAIKAQSATVAALVKAAACVIADWDESDMATEENCKALRAAVKALAAPAARAQEGKGNG